MQFSKDQLALKEKARHVAETYVRPKAAEHDRTGEYPHEVMKEIVKAGLMGVWIPQEFGGGGKGVVETCIIVEELSRACGGIGVAFAVNALGSFPLTICENEPLKKRFLPRVASGQDYIAFGLSEIAAGSDAGSLTARADPVADGFEITGAKKWTTNAGVANLFTVFANADVSKGPRGVTALSVERGTPGFTIGRREDTMGIRCVPIHELKFDKCKVPAGNQLCKEGRGFALAMATLDKARPGVAAQAVGLAQGALDLAAQFVCQRKQFGKLLSEQQALQFMLADMAVQVQAARSLVYDAAVAIDQGDRRGTALASMAKVFATDVAMRVTTDATQLFGGYGYVRDYPIEKFMRDAKITQIYEGTNQIQRLVISRILLKETMALVSDPKTVLVRPPVA